EPATSAAATKAPDPMQGDEAGQVRDDNGLKMKLVWCPPGFVTMEEFAPTGNEPAAKRDDGPRDDDDPKDKPASQARQATRTTPVKVFVAKGYWLGKYEVLQSEWKPVMKTVPWKDQRFTKEGADFPATCVTWDAAMEFSGKLNEQERQANRL